MRTDIPVERFDGSAPAPFAVYRPSGPLAHFLSAFGSSFLGIAHVSGLAVMEDRRGSLVAREKALVAAAETLDDPSKVLEALNTSADERAAIGAEIDQLDAQIKTESARRQREREAPALPSAEEIVEKLDKVEKKAPAPFASLGEQLKAVHAAAIGQKNNRPADPRLTAIQEYQATRAAIHGASEVVGGDGGWLVQTDLQAGLLNAIFTGATVAPLATTREVGAGFNGVKFNVIDETSRATGSRYGGVRVYSVAEGGTKTASRPKLRQEEITLAKAAAMYVATDELLADTTALESFVRPAFVSEFAFWLDDKMYRGTGAGEPLGILNANALIAVSKLTGQAADGIEYENLIAMIGRLSPGSLRNARWFVNQGLWSLFPLMTFTIGTGGVPVFLPPGGLSDAPFGTLLGRPIEVIEQASAPGDLGDILLADWSEYLLLRKGGIESDSSIHVYFDTDETAFRWVLRINGRPIRETPVTPYKGSATTSPFVTLQAR